MNKDDARKDLANIRSGMMILDPDDDDSIVTNLINSTRATKQTLKQMAAHLQSFSEHLPKEHSDTFKKAAMALLEITGDPAWKKADDLALLIKAALDGLEDQLEMIAKKE